MRPIALITGILLGSGVAITLGLGVVLLIYLLIGTDEPTMRREIPALAHNTLIFLSFTLVLAGAFYTELKLRAWRWVGRSGLTLALATVIIYYWP